MHDLRKKQRMECIKACVVGATGYDCPCMESALVKGGGFLWYHLKMYHFLIRRAWKRLLLPWY